MREGGRAIFAPGFVIAFGPHPHVRKSTLRCGPNAISRHPSKIAPASMEFGMHYYGKNG